MTTSTVPELQQKLFKRMGIDVPGQNQGSRQGFNGKRPLGRKEQRKAQRVQKRTHVYASNQRPRNDHQPQRRAPIKKRNEQLEVRPIEKIRGKSETSLRVINPELEDDSLDEDDFLDGDDSDLDLDDEEDVSDGNEDEDDGSDDEGKGTSKSQTLSQSQREKLKQDDAVIEDFERKLGIRKGRRELPQAFKDDGLDLLMGDLDEDGDEDEESDIEARKRKSDYDDWLSAKRRKTDHAGRKHAKHQGSEDEDGADDSQNDLSDDEDLSGEDYDEGPLGEDSEDEGLAAGGSDDDSFGGFDSDEASEAPTAPRKRENPYVAPTTGQVVAKYVPPSLRKASNAEGEARTRLRKQVQGLVNRLTDANILSIIQSVEELYQNNPRGDVTEALTDTVLAQLWKTESLPDQFFALTGGFCAATYKIIGASFGSHLIRRVVNDFNEEYNKAKDIHGDDVAIPKEASNLLALLSQLYVFDVVSCRIIFDLMERFLNNLTEINVELLLRICKMAGRLLRRDDSQSLKHVSSVLGKAVAKIGYSNVSARTKFMIETIDDLKSSKPKAKGTDSAVVSEHVSRMKKRLGELKSQSRRLDGLAPMGIGLEDVENADVKGKWWLVGASVPAKSGGEVGAKHGHRDDDGNDEVMLSDHEDMDFVLPDYPMKARAQGLATPTQIAIFTALLSATDAESGYRQFIDLRLKKDEQNEIARVLVQCVGSEAAYNPYYAIVAHQACNNRKIRFSFQNRLWQIFRGLGETLFGEDTDYEETADSERMKDEQRISNVAQFYGALFEGGSLSITVLKPLELPKISSLTSMFMERLIITLLKACRSKNEEKEDMMLGKIFGATRELPVLAAGLHWFMRKRVRKTKLISSKEVNKLEKVRLKAQELVQGGHGDG